ncbi:MAG: glycosyltransferase family 2 protein [Gammaproteobacteria bacterium]|nr:glycosyltransferase family 2 protein [Gammaproteobacteria bacterium]MDH5652064.1 glycosyltransferase family 2 protein [Gammaproteobacteria bacterium]
MQSVSVIIPTMGRPELLLEAINSVQNQTTPPVEIIVVDAHPDLTAMPVIDKLKQNQNSIIYIEGGGGASVNRNNGAWHAGSDWVAFLDDDDMWEADYLEKAVSLALHENTDATITWMKTYNGQTFTEDKKIGKNLQVESFFVKNPGVTGSNIVMKKETFEALSGFDKNLLVSEDKDLLLRLIDSGRSYSVVQEMLVIRRVHGVEHLSSAASLRFLNGIKCFYNKYKNKMSFRTRRDFKGKIDWSAYQCTNSIAVRLWYIFRIMMRGNLRYLLSILSTLKNKKQI